jgi:hypothetical protein
MKEAHEDREQNCEQAWKSPIMVGLPDIKTFSTTWQAGLRAGLPDCIRVSPAFSASVCRI